MASRANMRHDLHEFLSEMSRREKFSTWITYYWWPTRRWMAKVSMWWAYHVLRIPKPPPLAEDRVALHHGFVEGVLPCTDGPICAEHGWRLSPLVAQSHPLQSGAQPTMPGGTFGPESASS